MAELLQTFGWARERIVDLGDITASRGMEPYLAFWIRLRVATGTSDVNIKLVR